MTEKDKAIIQRMLGAIEGIAFIIADERIADVIFDCVKTIDQIIDKEGD